LNDFVSIALAVYNGEKYLSQLLASLEQQTIKPFELVVLDDCSSDNSIKIIREFPLSFTKRIYSNEKNQGPVFTFRKLAQLCKGEFIAFCDQDDIWLPQKIELSLSSIKKLETDLAAIVFSDLRVIDEEGKLLHNSFFKLRSTKPGKFSLADILFGNIVTGCASIINRAMASELARMPLNAMMYDHWAALIGYSFGKHSFINEPLILYRAHGTNVTDKHKASFVKNFINELKNKPAYLQKNIQQATEFRNLYADQLNAKNLKTFDSFIALKQRPFFYKRFMRDKRSLLRRLK
jgi:glycosyltransferase involved in cell wall biosynthesis